MEGGDDEVSEEALGDDDAHGQHESARRHVAPGGRHNGAKVERHHDEPAGATANADVSPADMDDEAAHEVVDGDADDREAVLVGAAAASSGDTVAGSGVSPILPYVEAKPPSPMYRSSAVPMTGAATWYRTDQDRYKSVHRRANPWFRRLARGVIGLSFVAAIGVGLFLGARLVQDYLDRDRLPAAGAETPDIRATSFEVRSTAPAPIVDGTITLDTTSGAFEFAGRGTGSQAGTQLVSPDGATVFIRLGTGPWQLADGSVPVAADVRKAVSYLRDDHSADAILTSQLRRGYVELVGRTEIGEGDDEIRRYQLRLDIESFDADFPLQHREFQDRALPSVAAVRALPLTIALDDDNVLVEVNDETGNWSWQRLTYSDQPFVPLDPADQLLTSTIEITDGTLDD